MELLRSFYEASMKLLRSFAEASVMLLRGFYEASALLLLMLVLEVGETLLYLWLIVW